MRSALAALALALLLPVASAQTAERPPADPADTASIGAIIAATYATISGPATEPRDWERFRSLFLPDARLATRGGTSSGLMVLTTDGYIDIAGPLFRDSPAFQGKGFYEVESARRVERYGSVAHVWSTYESRFEPAGAPFARGINSFQLFWDGTRWSVLTIFWHQEDEQTPIPAPYLPQG